jgi:hypothetical protein
MTVVVSGCPRRCRGRRPGWRKSQGPTACIMAASVGSLVILAIYPACRATVLGMTALKQLVFSLAFAIAAVAAAQYVMWILNGQP